MLFVFTTSGNVKYERFGWMQLYVNRLSIHGPIDKTSMNMTPDLGQWTVYPNVWEITSRSRSTFVFVYPSLLQLNALEDVDGYRRHPINAIGRQTLGSTTIVSSGPGGDYVLLRTIELQASGGAEWSGPALAYDLLSSESSYDLLITPLPPLDS